MSFLPSTLTAKAVRESRCIRERYHAPPPAVVELLRRHHPGTHVRNATPTEYCAAHLDSITEPALTALHDSAKGIPVNYRDLPSILWEPILPHHLPQLTVGPAEIHRMQVTAGRYSNMSPSAGPFTKIRHKKKPRPVWKYEPPRQLFWESHVSLWKRRRL